MQPTDQLPEGFVPVVDPQPDTQEVHVLKPAAFSGGGVAIFKCMQKLGQGDKAFEVYVIASAKRPDAAELLAVRRTAQLDRLLAGLRPGEKFYLRYMGQEEHPRVTGGFIHQWQVGREPGRAPVPGAVGTARAESVETDRAFE